MSRPNSQLRACVWITAVVALILGACTHTPGEHVLTGETMGTTYTVKWLASASPTEPAHIERQVRQILERVDRAMSLYRSDSEIGRINAARSTEWLHVSSDLRTVLDAAASVSRASGGAFDVTVAPLVRLWGFGAEDLAVGGPPSLAALNEARAHIGFDKLEVRADPPAIRKRDPHVAIDLNAIAPGFAVDEIARMLERSSIDNYLVEIGGEIRARGRNGRGRVWRVAIERPEPGAAAPLAVVPIERAAVATSGEYRNFYVYDGKRYSHTVDPRTAWPIQHRLACVVVVMDDAIRADAWATALNVLGPEDGMVLAEKLDLAALFVVDEAGELRARMTRRFTALDPQLIGS